MSALHVGYVLKKYPRLAETFIVNEILELERQGARVTVFSLHPGEEGPTHERLSRVKADVVYLPFLSSHGLLQFAAENSAQLASTRSRIAPLLWEELEKGEEATVKNLAKAMVLHLEAQRRGITHLHAHFGTSATTVARSVSRMSGIPYSFTAHAKDIYLASHDPRVLAAKMRDAAFVVTVCDANQEHLSELCAPGTVLHRLYNGLDLDEFRPAPAHATDRFEILGVGRLVPKKGFDTLIRASRILKSRGLSFRVQIIGTGLEREALERLVRSEDVEDTVELMGPLPNEQVRTAMCAADVLALPCRIADDGNRDALPTVLLEAMALGRPFVSTPITGIPEIAGSGKTGVLVPEDKPDELADALEKLAADPGTRAALGIAGRRRVRELFDIRTNVAELHRLFEEHAASHEEEAYITAAIAGARSGGA